MESFFRRFYGLLPFLVRELNKTLSVVLLPTLLSLLLRPVCTASRVLHYFRIDTTLRFVELCQLNVHRCVALCHRDLLRGINTRVVFLSSQHHTLLTVVLFKIIVPAITPFKMFIPQNTAHCHFLWRVVAIESSLVSTIIRKCS